ncbi:MAG: PilN domain-containing protein [Gemmatimonadetes bacterium]|nr:PilN domain-containing protein [Gemmatimonadota bacterium]
MIEVNLLPDSQGSRGGGKRAKKKGAGPSLGGGLGLAGKGGNPWSTALLLAGLVVPLAAGFLWWSQRSSAASLQTRLDSATADSARLAELRQVSDSLTARRTEIRDRVALVEQLDRNRFVWPHMMDEISRAVPRMAWLSSLRQTAPLPDVGVQIQGIAANPLAITEFVRNLEASDYITDVRILGSQRQGLEADGDNTIAAQSFTLTARFAEPEGGAMRTEPIIANTGGG